MLIKTWATVHHTLSSDLKPLYMTLTILPESISLQMRKWKWHQWARKDGWIGSAKCRWEILKRWLVSMTLQMCHGFWWQTSICPMAKLCALALQNWSSLDPNYLLLSDQRGAKWQKSARWNQIFHCSRRTRDVTWSFLGILELIGLISSDYQGQRVNWFNMWTIKSVCPLPRSKQPGWKDSRVSHSTAIKAESKA